MIRRNAATVHNVLVLDMEFTTRATSSVPRKRRHPFHFIGLGGVARKETFNPLIFFVQVGDKYRFSGRTVRDNCVGLIVLPSPGILLTIVHEVLLILLKLCGDIELNPGSPKQPHDDVLKQILKGQKEITEMLQEIKASQSKTEDRLGAIEATVEFLKCVSVKVDSCVSGLNSPTATITTLELKTDELENRMHRNLLFFGIEEQENKSESDLEKAVVTNIPKKN